MFSKYGFMYMGWHFYQTIINCLSQLSLQNTKATVDNRKQIALFSIVGVFTLPWTPSYSEYLLGLQWVFAQLTASICSSYSEYLLVLQRAFAWLTASICLAYSEYFLDLQRVFARLTARICSAYSEYLQLSARFVHIQGYDYRTNLMCTIRPVLHVLFISHKSL